MHRLLAPARHLLSALALVASSACASSGTAGAPELEPTPTISSVPAAPPEASGTAVSFTEAQADRGREVFRGRCTECHSSRDFSDSQFTFKWGRRNAGALYQMIQTQMPETDPGSLSPEETVAIVTYILRMNGFATGPSELAADRAVLDGISLASIRND